MTIVIQIEHFDKDGNLTKIEAIGSGGEHLLDFLWDERDPQDRENRLEFRKWVNRHLKTKGYDVAE